MRGIVCQARCIHSRRLVTTKGLPVPAAAAGRVMASNSKQTPVLLLDVMDTIVTDPFFEHMPRFFNLTFKELLAAKHPTAWVEFENDMITEDELFVKFFADGRQFDGQALVQHMVSCHAVMVSKLCLGCCKRSFHGCTKRLLVGLSRSQVEHYRYIDGMPGLLHRLKQAGYTMHAMSNYPKW